MRLTRFARSFALAWVFDEDESERAHGVTTEVGQKCIETDKFKLTVLDSPGHADFVPMMITGASNADVGILVVAGVTGEFEAGFELGGQTREHVLLARGLGVNQLIVAVNKLDASEPMWSEARFLQIKNSLTPFLVRCGFKPNRVTFVPVSGLTGENVRVSGEEKLQEWGTMPPTLIKAIDSFFPAQRNLDKPLRIIVNDVYSEGKVRRARNCPPCRHNIMATSTTEMN